MSQIQLDKCPKCGTPYMSSARPGEKPEDRQCYTCGSAASTAVAPPPADESLDLQPLDDAPSSQKRGRIPQIAPVKRGTTAQVKVKPSGRAKPPEINMPVRDEMAPEYASSVNQPAASARHRAVYSESGVPQMAPTARATHTRSAPDFVKPAITAAAAAVAALGAYFFVFKSKPAPQSQQAVASKTPDLASKKVDPPKSAALAIDTTVSPSKKIERKPERDPIGLAGPAPVTGVSAGLATERTAAAANAPPATAIAPTTPDDVLGQPSRKKPKRGGDDDDDEVAKPVEKSKGPVASTPAAPAPVKAPVEPARRANLDPVAADAQPALADPPAPEDPAANPDGEKEPKKKLSVNDLLGKKDAENDDPKKHELDKKEDPFAVKVVAVTATEPTVMPLDIERLGGNDKTLTEQLSLFLKNWRIRDSFFDTSKIGVPHNNRDYVIVLNPMNDTLPAKLACTVEIPAKFAGARPVLLFEVTSAVPAQDWMVAVRALNVLILPKTRVQMKKDQVWQDVAVDLSPLANKHFELQIEVYANAKGQKKIKDELGYIRNVRIEWVGMKK